MKEEVYESFYSLKENVSKNYNICVSIHEELVADLISQSFLKRDFYFDISPFFFLFFFISSKYEP